MTDEDNNVVNRRIRSGFDNKTLAFWLTVANLLGSFVVNTFYMGQEWGSNARDREAMSERLNSHMIEHKRDLDLMQNQISDIYRRLNVMETRR
jgi:hypothetical protein